MRRDISVEATGIGAAICRSYFHRVRNAVAEATVTERNLTNLRSWRRRIIILERLDVVVFGLQKHGEKQHLYHSKHDTFGTQTQSLIMRIVRTAQIGAQSFFLALSFPFSKLGKYTDIDWGTSTRACADT